MNDTIAAIATPFGSGGIGVIRISGPEAFRIASALFSKTRFRSENSSVLESHKVLHGYILDPENDEVIDEVLLIPMQGPRSYTAEDIVEIQAHSGTVVLRVILDQVLSSGARLSRPGEFTRRAFLNSRIDLTQAESVVDIINAKSERFLRYASSQNFGVLRNRIQELRKKLIEFLSEFEASIDFPDDIEPFEPLDREIKILDDIILECGEFIKRYDDTCFLKDGVRIVICGGPNVGKSSLMNRLLGQDRSIVTEVPGTTRDSIEEGFNIEGFSFILTDTAGIHRTDDLVEIIGIERAKDHIRNSDLVLYLKEPGTIFRKGELGKIIPLEKKIILIINKIDLARNDIPQLPEEYGHIPQISISALFNTGIDELKKKILDICVSELDMEKFLIIPNLRHKKALEQTVRFLESARTGIREGREQEILAIDIKNGIDSLGEITGETASIDILDNIFNNFCIGK